jgi:putative transposase
MQPISYACHRFPAEIIRHAIWLYLRFTLSYRDVEELLAERGIETSYKTGLPRSGASPSPAASEDRLCYATP